MSHDRGDRILSFVAGGLPLVTPISSVDRVVEELIMPADTHQPGGTCLRRGRTTPKASGLPPQPTDLRFRRPAGQAALFHWDRRAVR